MNNDRRKLIYLRQNGSVDRLTPAQRRRITKKTPYYDRLKRA